MLRSAEGGAHAAHAGPATLARVPASPALAKTPDRLRKEALANACNMARERRKKRPVGDVKAKHVLRIKAAKQAVKQARKRAAELAAERAAEACRSFVKR